jgi:hypothetical protein
MYLQPTKLVFTCSQVLGKYLQHSSTCISVHVLDKVIAVLVLHISKNVCVTSSYRCQEASFSSYTQTEDMKMNWKQTALLDWKPSILDYKKSY